MSQECFTLVCRASLLMLLTGSCVLLLSRFFPSGVHGGIHSPRELF